jgi:uncharacterized protein involved in type VI secretion and phage assembly
MSRKPSRYAIAAAVIVGAVALLGVGLYIGSRSEPATQSELATPSEDTGRRALSVLHKSVGQAVATSALTTITWDDERTDELAAHSGSSADLIIDDPGIYVLDVHGAWSANGTGSRYAHLELEADDSVPQIVDATSRAALDESSHRLHWEGRITEAMIPCAFRVVVYQNSGADLYYGGPDGSTTGSPWARPDASGGVSVNVEFSVVRGWRTAESRKDASPTPASIR